MMKRLLLTLLCLPLYAQAENVLLKLSPEQIKSQSITAQALNSFEAGGGRRLPAQVVVPPRQIEVISAPLAGAVTAVLAAYGESVDSGQPLARMQGEQMLALQRDYIQAQAQDEVASENRRACMVVADRRGRVWRGSPDSDAQSVSGQGESNPCFSPWRAPAPVFVNSNGYARGREVSAH